jgi:hypothetical protein
MAASPALAVIGHNNPPTPFEVSRDRIADLYVEAKNWCDGEPIDNEASAAEVRKLLDMLGEEIRTADARRKTENEPFDAGKAEVQARYNTLIGDTKSVKGKAILAQAACRQALTPWLQKQEAERQATAEAARKEAEAKAREAALAFQVTRADDLEEREEAEALAREAKAAEAAARKASKPTAAGLRTVTRSQVTDYRTFLRWIAENRPEALRGMLDTYAETLCAQKVRDVPGVSFTDERVAR